MDIDKATQSQIENIEKATGKKLEDWIKLVNSSGFSKHGEIIKFLKENHGLGHGNANLLVHFAKQSHAGASDDADLISEQYNGKEELKEFYDFLIHNINKFGSDVELAPKKAYVSLRRKKQFAIIQPSTKTRLDVGLNIKEAPFTKKLEQAGSWNSMCTHRIRIEEKKEIDAEVFEWIKKAYDQAG